MIRHHQWCQRFLCEGHRCNLSLIRAVLSESLTLSRCDRHLPPPHPNLPPEGEGARFPPPLGEGRVGASGAKMFTLESKPL